MVYKKLIILENYLFTLNDTARWIKRESCCRLLAVRDVLKQGENLEDQSPFPTQNLSFEAALAEWQSQI